MTGHFNSKGKIGRQDNFLLYLTCISEYTVPNGQILWRVVPDTIQAIQTLDPGTAKCLRYHFDIQNKTCFCFVEYTICRHFG